MAKLEITLPDGREISHELTEESATVGRVSDNTIRIDDASVSSHHAELTRIRNDVYRVKDLGSTNGTKVAGESITEAELKGGEAIRFGKVDAVYVTAAAGDAQPLPESEPVAQRPAQESHRPADFSNVSPFPTRVRKKKDPVGAAVIAFAIVSMLAFAAALAMVLTLQPPV